MSNNQNISMISQRLKLFAILLLAIFYSCTQTNKQDQSPEIDEQGADWVALFNGNNLDGWTVKSVKEDQHYNFWSINNGTIVLNSMGSPNHDYNWLITEKEYTDFELKLKFQSYRDSPGNSGVQIRSRYDDEGQLEGSDLVGWLDGPQIDIHPSDPWRIGFIYDETRGHQRWIFPDLPDWNIDKATYAPEVVQHYYSDETPNWNELLIVCKGNHITTQLNGNVVADYDGQGVLDDAWHQKFGIDKSGFIALQLHKDDEIKIAFKEIYIKEL